MSYSDTYEEVSAVVLDQGSQMCRAGLAGEVEPTAVFSSVVGRPLLPQHRAALGLPADGVDSGYVGDIAQAHREMLALRYPMKNGNVRSWTDLEFLWRFVFDDSLQVKSEERTVLVSVHPRSPYHDYEMMVQLLFETFNTPNAYLALQPLLAFYASGRGPGVTIECGDGAASVIPVWQGYTVPNAILRVNLAGADVTDHLGKLLGERGYAFTTSAEREIVRDIKEKLCYVPLDPEQEAKRGREEVEKTYTLPDGQTITLGDERFRAPEVLFQPELLDTGADVESIVDMLYRSIMTCDVDLRADLLGKIIISGGTTMLPGFADRVTQEIRAIAHKGHRVRVVAMPDRKYAAWIGGSLLASLSTFQQMWITKQEYDEHGPLIVHRKCPTSI